MREFLPSMQEFLESTQEFLPSMQEFAEENEVWTKINYNVLNTKTIQ